MNLAKLSNLQRWILARAAQRPDVSPSFQARDLIAARVIHEFYGIPTTTGAAPKWSSKNFSQQGTDRRFYDAAKAAVSKAFRRLEERNLVRSNQGGTIVLTDQGSKAIGLLMDKPSSCKPFEGAHAAALESIR